MNTNVTQPKTLREFAGLAAAPPPLSESVVLVVDAQKEYTDGSLPLRGIAESVRALGAFLQTVREKNVPVIHIVQKGKPGGAIMDPDGPFSEIIDEVKPEPGEVVVEKTYPSSFTATTLEDELKKLGRKSLVVTGYMTHMCLNSTVREATERGYQCTVVDELTATRDLPDGHGGVIPAQTVKAVHLAGLADRFAVVVPTADALS